MNHLSKILSLFLFLTVALMSCKSGSNDDTAKDASEEVLDPNSSLNTVFEGKIFSIPSPIQSAMMIKALDLNFNSDIIQTDYNTSQFNTSTKQALNLGVYGGDLAYASVYGKHEYCLKSLAALRKLSSQLGLNSTFDKSFLDRFENNLANLDSMVLLASDAFRRTDLYLKSSNRKTISALILTGGWVESMYIACELNAQKPSSSLSKSIGEQRTTLSTLIALLEEYNTENEFSDLVQGLKDLEFYFDKIDYKYIYKAPKTDAANKITTLNHQIDIKIDTDIQNQITLKVRTLRANITS